MDTSILLNSTHSEEITIQHEDTAAVYGSGSLEVFATPAMVALMEFTCLNNINSQLDLGDTSVGTSLNIKHLKASPVGNRIHCDSKVIKTEGRKILFEVKCYEEGVLVGEGTHERVIVNSERFMSKFK